VVRSPSPIFLKFYSNCHYPIWWTSAKLGLSKVKGHGPPKLTVSSCYYKFSKIFKLVTVLFLDSFRSYLDELLLIKLSLTLENFIAKYHKVCEISWFKLGTKWKTRKVGYLCCLGSPVMGKPFDLTNVLIFCNKIFQGQR